MRIYKFTFLALVVFGLALGTPSCKKDNPDPGNQIANTNPYQELNNQIERSLALDRQNDTISVEDTVVLKPRFGKGQVPEKFYSWQVDNEDIVKVLSIDEEDYTATIVAKKRGSATVTLLSYDRTLSASCSLVVAGPPKDGIIRILAIGNSFSEDAVEHYLHGLAAAAGIKVIIGNMYIGGASLATHWENAANDKPAYDFRLIDQHGNKSNLPNTTLSDALASDYWNYISFQQVSQETGQYNTYVEPLPKLYNYVKKKVENPETKFVFHEVWAYQQGATHPGFANYDNDQLTMYNAIVDAVWKAAGLVPIDFVIPSGTAIQNGRTTKLGDHFNRDGYHLNALGQYTAACTWFESIFGKNVIGNPFIPLELTGEEAEIAQHAAHAAAVNPKEITELTDYLPPPPSGIQGTPVFIGFGSENIPDKWNAFIGDHQAGEGSKIENLVDFEGNNTGASIEITKPFNGRNNAGEGGVTAFGMNIPDNIAMHSYYGNAKKDWGGRVITESQVKISGLDKGQKYTICFFASRAGVGDNREAKYVAQGENSVTVTLDAANNKSNTVCAEQVQPDGNGTITVTITSGSNNTNEYGFFYINVMKIARSD